MSFLAYEKYKPSNVEWLGDVPTHWAVDRIKVSIMSSRNGIWGDEAKGDENDIPCVRVADFDRTALRVILDEPTIRNVTEKEREGRILERGNLLLEKSGGGEKQPVGCIVLYDLNQSAICSNFVARIQLNSGMNSSYWCYVHSAAYAVRLTTGSINQTSGIQNLDQDRYFNERAPFPPTEEQAAIATFLDCETAKIDALIAEQEKLIALLAEKRQAIISHAVTKGLDPNAPMKDSGVAWLGEVPEHWSSPPLYMRYSSELGKMLDANRITGRYLIPYLRNIDVQWDVINLSDLPQMDIEESEYGRYTIRRGDLLVCEGGEVGRAAVVQTDELIGYQKALHRLRPRSDQEHPRYMYYTFVWASKAGAFSGEGQSTIAHLTGEQLRKYRFPTPPLAEQQEISNYLDIEFGRLRRLISESEQAIDLLKERRSALITAAVTGQIDVRNAVQEVSA